MPYETEEAEWTAEQVVWKREYAAALKKYPNACGVCSGSGLHYTHGSYYEQPSQDPCPSCLEDGHCPRCGEDGDLVERKGGDYFVCESCDYDEETNSDAVLPPHPMG